MLSKKKYLIMHVSTSFNRAGSFYRLFKRLRALADNGYGVALVVGREYDPSPEWDMSGIAVYRVRSLVKYISPGSDFKALVNLIRILRVIHPDLVHTHMAKAGILGRWAAYMAGIPNIFHTVHGPTFASTLPFHKRGPYFFLERLSGKITDYFVFVGEEIRMEYVNARICCKGNSFIVRTGRPDAEIDAIHSLSRVRLNKIRCNLLGADDSFTVVCVGRVVPSKQQDHAIRVIHQLRQKGINAKMILIGEAFLDEEKSHIQALRRLVRELRLNEHVCFAGYRDDALEIMAAADAILHTSRYEGLPNVLVEAALVARPIITYAVTGAEEVILNGETGFIVPQGNIEAASEKMYELAMHPAKAREMGKAGFEKISGDYRESAMIRNKLDFYDKILGTTAD